MLSAKLFPHLTAANHRVISPPTTDYNCIAWCADDTKHWWQPGNYWPTEASSSELTIAALEQAFRALGYERCEDGALELGRKKVALYATEPFYTHAARQLPTGKWTSKLGKAEDIEHDAAENLADGLYGRVFMFMKRDISSAASAET